MITFDRARELALALPSAEEAVSFGTPSFKVGKKLFARLREDGSLMVKTEPGLREALIAAHPDRYFTTPHYVDYPSVLVRLDQADEDELHDLMVDAWAIVAPKRLKAAFAERAQ